MIRVLWVVGGIGHGGVITVCRDAAAAVASDPGFSVTLLSPDPAYSLVEDPKRVKVVVLNAPPDRDKASRRFLEWLAANPQDVVLFNDAAYVEPAWPFMAPQTATIGVLHDVAVGWQQPMLWYRESLDAVVAVSRFVRDSLQENLRDNSLPVHVIHNGLAFGPVPAKRDAADTIRLLYAGSSDPFKGAIDLPRIADHLTRIGVPFELVWIGTVDDAVLRAKELRDLGTRLNVAGHVSHDTCLDWMARSDILVMPSRAEPFGMVTVEAMGMGCIPVAYDAPSGTTEIVTNERNGFLVPLGDYAAFARACERLHRDRPFMREIRDRGVKDARAVFSAERMGDEYARLIRSVTGAVTGRQRRRKPAEEFAVETRTTGLWVRLVPAVVRRLVRRLAARNPRAAWRLRRWLGWGRV